MKRSIRRPAAGTLVAFFALLAACASPSEQRALAGRAPSNMTGAIQALFREVVVAHTCRKLNKSFLALPHPADRTASSGTAFVTSCQLQPDVSGRLQLSMSGVLWEGDYRNDPDAYLRGAVALGWTARIDASLTVREEPTGAIRLTLAPGTFTSGSARLIGPAIARPKSLEAGFLSLIGQFDAVANSRITAHGNAEFNASLRSAVELLFNPETLQVWREASGPGSLPFAEPSWLLNERVMLGREMFAIRGPFMPAESVRMRLAMRGDSPQIGLACADSMITIDSTAEARGAEGARAAADGALASSVPAADGVVFASPGVCDWVVVLRSADAATAFDILLQVGP